MNGFLYYISGSKHAVQLLVSIVSLRAVGHNEPICICYGDDTGKQWAETIASDQRLGDIMIIGIAIETAGVKKRGKARQHCGKAAMGSWTPFEKTIFLDADTLVVSNLEVLWPRSEEVVLTNFATWKTTGNKLKSRLRKYRAVLPEEVARMTGNAYPAINTGVLAWDKGAWRFHERWREITLNHLIDGNPIFMGDEIVANLIFPNYCHRVMSDLWNFSPVYSVESRNGLVPTDVKVWHYHGGKHCKIGPARDSWFPMCQYTLEHNFANIQAWAPAGDRSLALLLEEQHECQRTEA